MGTSFFIIINFWSNSNSKDVFQFVQLVHLAGFHKYLIISNNNFDIQCIELNGASKKGLYKLSVLV